MSNTQKYFLYGIGLFLILSGIVSHVACLLASFDGNAMINHKNLLIPYGATLAIVFGWKLLP